MTRLNYFVINNMLYIYYYFLNNSFFQKFFKNIFLHFFCSIIFLKNIYLLYIFYYVILIHNTCLQHLYNIKDITEYVNRFT